MKTHHSEFFFRKPSTTKLALNGLLLPGIFLLGATSATAATAVSNLGNFQNSSWIIGNGVGSNSEDAPIAMSFTTGSGTSWNLDQVTLLLQEDLNVTGSITVDIFSDNAGSPGLGSSIATLNGPDPSGTTFAQYTYTPASAVSLAGSSTYWVVVSGPYEGGLPDTYDWAFTDDTNESSALTGWSIGDKSYQGTIGTSSADWDNWVELGNPTMLSIDATMVPEPSTMVLTLGASLLCLSRRRRN